MADDARTRRRSVSGGQQEDWFFSIFTVLFK
jgi:hypothetical protein